MAETITITGNIATEPTVQATGEGVTYTRFRVACTQRKRNPDTGEWVDGESNWYTVYAYRALAENAIKSLSKGMRVIVSGALRVRDWERDERRGTNVDVMAESLGPDLRWGRVKFESTSTGRRREDERTEQVPGVGDEWMAPPAQDTGASGAGELPPEGGAGSDGQVPIGEAERESEAVGATSPF
ncbi:single-stranded DNA-binding protein [Microbacterium suaedae]|uniref:single-stranded DNA-binding protein n=1 Tax=Microbacterium suaedae TaxID=2067813 RepID=UPI000DA1AE6E|nr:single-stranded DNA-binding protein [Microbacterium suaedae]